MQQPKSDSMLMRFAARDVLLIALAGFAWWLHPGAGPHAWHEPASSALVGLAVGVAGYLVHEWAHYLAGRLVGSQMGVADSLSAISLFDFDPERNNRTQFVVMSLGGFAATAAFIIAGLTWLPLETLAGRVAMGSLFFLAFLGVVLETPLLIYGLWADGLPPVGTPRGSLPESS